ncbi:hypothetical protein CEJ87_18070 [Caldifermentibacillus hisashii]|nr:hypothetical protein CEJ87_18070 [Caldifermentibacillus hisashii]
MLTKKFLQKSIINLFFYPHYLQKKLYQIHCLKNKNVHSLKSKQKNKKSFHRRNMLKYNPIVHIFLGILINGGRNK